MQVKFATDALRLLFEDALFKDQNIGVKATKTYRLVVNLIFAASEISDLANMRLLNLCLLNKSKSCYVMDIDKTKQLIMNLKGQNAEIIEIRKKELT